MATNTTPQTSEDDVVYVSPSSSEDGGDSDDGKEDEKEEKGTDFGGGGEGGDWTARMAMSERVRVPPHLAAAFRFNWDNRYTSSDTSEFIVRFQMKSSAVPERRTLNLYNN